MKKSTSLILALVTTTSLVITAGAVAKRGGEGHTEHMIDRATERLELDTNQADALRALADELQETRQLMRGEAGNLTGSLAGMLDAESFDQAQALALIDERIAALQANAPELIAAAGQFVDGLSPEQRADVQAFIERAGERHGRHGHHGRHHGDAG